VLADFRILHLTVERIGIMRRHLLFAFLPAVACMFLAGARTAEAQCPALPYQLSAGQVIDATQVMGNFDALIDCAGNKGTVNSGSSGQIAYYGTTGAVLSGGSLSDLLDLAFGSVRGSVLYRGVSGWAALAPGSSGDVLQSGGVSADPSWASTSGGGGSGINTIVGAGIGSAAPTVALAAAPLALRPALASFTWLNQASATASDSTNGPLVLRTSQNTGGSSINALIKGVAGSSWTVTVQYALGNHVAGSGDVAGLIVYNSVNGRLYVCGLGGGASINVLAYNSTTSWNSYAGAKTIIVNPYTVWTRAQYVSSTTTLTFSYSVDGFTWETIFSSSAPFVGVPTGYGIAVGTQRNDTGYVISLNYMAESTP
jgi:hypothetical protein